MALSRPFWTIWTASSHISISTGDAGFSCRSSMGEDAGEGVEQTIYDGVVTLGDATRNAGFCFVPLRLTYRMISWISTGFPLTRKDDRLPTASRSVFSRRITAMSDSLLFLSSFHLAMRDLCIFVLTRSSVSGISQTAPIHSDFHLRSPVSIILGHDIYNFLQRFVFVKIQAFDSLTIPVLVFRCCPRLSCRS